MVTKRVILHDKLDELLDSCISFYEKNKDRMRLERVREKRAKLSVFAKAFHEDCGTLTSPVRKRIEDLRDGTGLVLMTAHQPNFFAYSGVLRKATLNFVLAEKLERLLKVPVVSFFGIADQDFTDDRWVKSCQLPSVKRTGGILSIDVKLPERLILNKVAKPSHDLLREWRTEIEKWLDEAVRSVKKLCRTLGFQQVRSPSSSAVRENLMSFWDVVEDCYERSEWYSDFNAFIVSRIVNEIWGYDTIFSRFSECQQAFAQEFSFLVSRSQNYSRLLRESNEIPCDKDVGGGVSEQEPLLAPFWYHCDCGSKVRLFMERKDGILLGGGNCVSCGEYYELKFGNGSDHTISDFSSQISARAIPMCLVFFKGLMPSCYVGGAGGIRYLIEAQHVAEGLGIPFPPIAVWRPHDRYFGVGQTEAVLEARNICRDLGAHDLSEAKEMLSSRISGVYELLDALEESKGGILERLRERPNDGELKKKAKRISINQTKIKRSCSLSVLNRELKILENVSTVLNLIPSIIDYAVNVGLERTSRQWIQHLLGDGDFSSDVHLDSVLNSSLRNQLETKF